MRFCRELTRLVRCRGALWWALFGSILSAEANSEGGFVNVTGDAEIDYRQWSPPSGWFKMVPQVMTGGAAVADFDNDGWCDLVVTRYRETDILYRNRGNGTFEDVSEFAGLDLVAPTNGAAWGDVDNDGDADLYLSVADESPGPLRHLLYINQGDGSFVEQARVWGADLEAQFLHSGFSVCFGDYNLDGRLDIHTCQWGVRGPGNRSVLLMNRGEHEGFQDVTSNAGVELWDNPESDDGPDFTTYAFASRLTDLDRDGWPDLVVAGDYGTSQLFWNNGDGTFTDGTEQARIGGDENGMGLAVGDYDGDGLPDLFFTSIFDGRSPEIPIVGWGVTGNRLYRNLGNRVFEDATEVSGVRDGGWGWGAVFFDYDNDGDLDLAMTNGFETDRLETETPFHADPTRLWRNDGGTFTDVSDDMGVTDSDKGKGLLVFDYDKDGDLNLFIVNNLGFPILYRNDATGGNHWLRVKLRGTFSNRDGIGAVVTVERNEGGPNQYREISGGSHYLTQSEKIAHFGLGASGAPVRLVKVQWPSGIEQEFRNVRADQVLEVIEPETPYFAWLAQHFSPSEIEHGTETSPSADPDGDGRSNVMEFGMGLDPRNPDQSPPIQVMKGGGSGEALIKFRRRSLPRSVRVMLEHSADLQNWQTVEELEVVSVEPDDDWGVEVVTARWTLETSFLRMRVGLSD